MATMDSASFSAEAAEAALPMYKQILRMEFIDEMLAGTLDERIMAKYLVQDSIYLKQYSKVLAMVAARADDPHIVQTMALASHTALVVEGSLHSTFLKDFGAEGQAADAEPSPACFAYTNYLLAQAHSKSLPVAMASILPCYVIYNDVGRHILAQWKDKGESVRTSHPYRKWIEMYGGEDFNAATAQACKICDQLAAAATEDTRQEMMHAYLQASRLEWMFWDSAYHDKPWPISFEGYIP
jgi:thiaminase/transcriptional activator TenA